MRGEVTLADISPYVGNQFEFFKLWCEANPEALTEMEERALAIAKRGRRVSAKYLVEAQRYEGTAPLNPVPYIDRQGTMREYSINNSDTPYLARWMIAKHPELDIELRRSKADGEWSE